MCGAEVRSHNAHPVPCVRLKAHLCQRLIRKRQVGVLCRLLACHHRRGQVQTQLLLIVPTPQDIHVICASI